MSLLLIKQVWALFGLEFCLSPSSKTCSCCGQVKGSLPLSVRIFECVCGLKIDRDLNAALNLSQYGLGVSTALTMPK